MSWSQREAFDAFIESLELRHFSASELLVSASRPGNTPPPKRLWPNIAPTLLVLDALRETLGEPIMINSAYRAPDYNRRVGGGTKSQHMAFTALDFHVRNVVPRDVGRLLREWRQCRPWFESPVEIKRVAVEGTDGEIPFHDLAVRQDNGSGRAFRFRGGVGIYNTFVHLDTRGRKADWGHETPDPVCAEPDDVETTRGVIDRAAFFARVTDVFNRAPSTGQREGFHAILDAWERSGHTDPRWLAYALATAWHETGTKMQPVREGFKTSDEASIAHVTRMFERGRISKNYAKPEANGKSYFGRGYVQLTHGRNYKKMGEALGMDQALYDDPSLALDAALSARILLVGMTDGHFTGKKLPDYFNDTKEDWRSARRIVNALDRADDIAKYGRSFHAALTG